MDQIIIDNSALSVLLAIHQPCSQGPNPALGAGPGQRLWERGWHLPVSGPVHRGTLAQIFQFENATFSFRIQKFPRLHVAENIRIRCRIHRIRADGSRIWKENVASSKCGRGLISWARPCCNYTNYTTRSATLELFSR